MSVTYQVKKKNKSEAKDNAQDQLEKFLWDEIEKFFKKEEILALKLSDFDETDVQNSALLTLFTKSIAYISAQHSEASPETYLQGIFDAMSILFSRSRAFFVNALKDQDEKNSSSH